VAATDVIRSASDRSKGRRRAPPRDAGPAASVPLISVKALDKTYVTRAARSSRRWPAASDIQGGEFVTIV
jgi:hypothetical protein